jgi:hypothetical protein
MSDYNKLNIRFSNYGWNITQDDQALEFGQYVRLNNVVSNREGQLTGRAGLENLIEDDAIDAIRGLRRLNDSVQDESTYVIRASSDLYVTVDDSGECTTEVPFDFSEVIATGFSEEFGSILVHRTGFSNQVWAYIGDTQLMRKIAISPTDGGIDLFEVGMLRPQAAAPTLSATTGGSLTESSTYEYRYTFYDTRTGIESLFNENEADPLELTATQNQIDISIVAETLPTQATSIRLYRRSTEQASWLLVEQIDNLDFLNFEVDGVDYSDIIADVDIANNDILNELSDRPFTTVNASGDEVAGTPLPYLAGPIFGYVLACGDPINPGILYWTDRFNPDAQDPANFIEVTSPQDPLMNVLVYDGQPYVFSKENLYRLVLNDGEFLPYVVPTGRGLFFNHGFCVGPEIYWMSKDGIYACSGGTARLISDTELRPLFMGESVNDYSPVDFESDDAFCRMAYHSGEVWVSYRGTDGSVYFLIYDVGYRRWRFQNFRIGTEAIYDDEQTINQLLLGGSNGLLYVHDGLTDEGGDPETIPVRITTQTMTFGAPLIHKEFGHLIADLNPNGTEVTITVYTNNRANIAAIATMSDPARIRRFISIDTFAENMSIDIQWAADDTPPILYGYELLYRPDAVQLEKWSVTGVSHGLVGWQIARSAYITLRSNGTTMLTVTTNGIVNQYTLPSTGGLKQKLFVPFQPTKGKIFDYQLETVSATYFRLYNDMCEVHVKPWINTLGYDRVNPFQGGEGAAVLEAASGTPRRGSSQEGGTNMIGNSFTAMPLQ